MVVLDAIWETSTSEGGTAHTHGRQLWGLKLIY